MSQVAENPFKYSDTNKRYYTYDFYLKRTYGEKVAKIPLDCGFTCPNIDGKVGTGGCIYCTSGSRAPTVEAKDIHAQYLSSVQKAKSKWRVDKFIPYMQSYTNTYTDEKTLEKLLTEISSYENAVEICVATRADCLENEKIKIIDTVSKKIPITLELGLQSASDKTAKAINRCHTYAAFTDAFERLRKNAPEVKIGIHIIDGLPGENFEDMMNTAHSVADLHPDFVKIHLLYVARNTVLEKMYLSGEYTPMARADYVNTVCSQLEVLPPDTVVERLTGDGVQSKLVSPMWSTKKVCVINDIDKELFRRKTYQGINYKL